MFLFLFVVLTLLIPRTIVSESFVFRCQSELSDVESVLEVLITTYGLGVDALKVETGITLNV